MTTITPHTTRATGTILTAAIYNFDHQNHIGNATALRDGKIEGSTPPVVDGNPVVWNGTGGNALRTATAADLSTSLFIRTPLTAARTYFVRADGNDTNTGLVDSAGGAFLTIQKAIDTVYNTLDLRGNNVTIQVRTGTFGRAVVAYPQVGNGVITLHGDSVTPANVILTAALSVTITGVIDVQNGAVLNVKDLTVQGTGSDGCCMMAALGAQITFTNVRFGVFTNGQHMLGTQGGEIIATGNYAIVGGAKIHWWANDRGSIRVQSRTVTISGTPAFSSSFVIADYAGVVTANGNTYSGAATGARYNIQYGGIFFSQGNLTELPGNAAGSVLNNGLFSDYTWNTVLKTATETRASSAALANDSALQFPMAASTTYAVRIKVWYDTAATPGFKFALTGPTVSGIRIARKHISAAALTALVVASEVAYTASTSLPGGTNGGYIEFDLFVINAGTPGTFAFQWAQDTSNASNTTVQQGSYLEYRKVAP